MCIVVDKEQEVEQTSKIKLKYIGLSYQSKQTDHTAALAPLSTFPNSYPEHKYLDPTQVRR